MVYDDLKDYEVYALVASGHMTEEEFMTYIVNLHSESFESGWDSGYSDGFDEGYIKGRFGEDD